MNSEKVKEIKKGLEEQTQHKPINCSHSEYVEACGMYCRHRREFVADMGIKNGQTCENCNKFTATDEVKEYADILKLINELESEKENLYNLNQNLISDKQVLMQENERLMKLQARGGCRVAELGIENQQLKDRISELEKENAKLLDSVETVQSNRCVYKCVLTKEHLTKLAERLKEKLYNHRIWELPYEEWCKGNVVCGKIDETLKECLCENNQ